MPGTVNHSSTLLWMFCNQLICVFPHFFLIKLSQSHKAFLEDKTMHMIVHTQTPVILVLLASSVWDWQLCRKPIKNKKSPSKNLPMYHNWWTAIFSFYLWSCCSFQVHHPLPHSLHALCQHFAYHCKTWFALELTAWSQTAGFVKHRWKSLSHWGAGWEAWAFHNSYLGNRNTFASSKESSS